MNYIKGKKSNLVSDELRKLNKFLRKNNKTRWNSTYLMISSYLKLSREDVVKLLSLQTNKKNRESQKGLLLNQGEYEQLRELELILKDLYIFTLIVQGDNVTISKLLPALNTVVYNLNSLTDLKHMNSIRNKFKKF